MTTIFSEVTIGGDLVLKNRIALAPLTRSRCPENLPTEESVKYYVARASAGLLITEGTVVSDQGMGWAWVPKIYKSEHVEAWKKVTSAVHEAKGVIFCQLWHLGRVCHTSYHGLQPVGPSAIAANGEGALGADHQKHPYETPKEMTAEDIAATVEEFQNAAQCAKDAGFDGVELHFANGYLGDIFLQSKTNQRTDDYGGSPEKRFRFLKEVLQAVTTVYPANRVAVRLSPNGNFGDMGSSDNHAAFSYYIKELNSFGLAYLHLIDGLAFGKHDLCKQLTLYDARKAGYEGTLMGSTGYTKDTAQGAIGSGVVDMIAIGRPFLANPDLIERWQNGWPENPLPDYKYWFQPGLENVAEGYTDFHTYEPPPGKI